MVETIGSKAKSNFTGKIPKVTIEVKEMKQADKAKADARMRQEGACCPILFKLYVGECLINLKGEKR